MPLEWEKGSKKRKTLNTELYNVNETERADDG